MTSTIQDNRFGWPIADWAAAVGLCRASVYNLLDDGAIDSAKVGKRRLILTHPRDFLQTRRVTPSAA